MQRSDILREDTEMGRKKKEEEVESAEALLDAPLITENDYQGPNSTPFDRAYGALTSLSGAPLEIMTRTTRKLAVAITASYTMIANYKSPYLRGRMDTIMRAHVSQGGKGRSEMVQALQAGSGVPGEFYDAGNPNKNSFIDIEDEDPVNDEQS